MPKVRGNTRKKRKLRRAERNAVWTLPDRLQRIMTELDLPNESRLAEALGTSPSTCAPWHTHSSATRPNFVSLHRFYAKLSVNLNWLVTGEDVHLPFIDDEPELDASVSLVRRRAISRIATRTKHSKDDLESLIPEGESFLDWIADAFGRSQYK